MDPVDTWIFAFCIIDGLCLLFLTVYFIITLSDLECDYINATGCCSKLNRWVIAELVGHCLATVTLLLSGHWVIFLVSVPMTSWLIYRFVTKPSGNIGLYDPAEIHQRHQLKTYMTHSMVKLAHHLVFFFIFLYRLEKWVGKPILVVAGTKAK